MNKRTILVALSMTVIAMLAFLSAGNAAERNTDKKNKKEAVSSFHAVKELTEKEFNTTVYDMTKKNSEYLGTKPAIIDFTAKWCGPCQRIAPILDELAKEYGESIVIYKVDIDKNPELAKAFGISSIPAIMYIPTKGKPSMTVGSRDKARFQSEINTILLGK